MRAIGRVLAELLTYFLIGIASFIALILLAIYGLLLVAIGAVTLMMGVIALTSSIAWLFMQDTHVGLTALGYWGYTAVCFGLAMAVMGAKQMLVEIPERRQARREKARLERIGQLRLAQPDATFR